ncbi:class IV adenylate cyclase [Actinomadura gamaensis]|uniref:Class IV adenylate cyclase n=1 Tax=Actinomadura gamaensis TaxID=1763541 RepID=A0ABV9U914_9ACTN
MPWNAAWRFGRHSYASSLGGAYVGGTVRTREIEVKYRVIDADALERALEARGVVLSAPVRQDDQAYAPSWWDYGQSKAGVPFARLRTLDGVHLFTVKTPRDNEMDCAEAESSVNDREQMHAALLQMGFRPTVRIVKQRRTGRAGELTLCLDQVHGVGQFLEVETVVPDGEPGTETQVKLDAWARGLGVKLDRVTETYDSLIRAALR